MFCPLARLELKINHCPAHKCIYQSSAKTCEFDALTAEDITAQTIAEIKSVKTYKVKQEANNGRDSILKGVAILQYSNFIRDSFPNVAEDSSGASAQTVNGAEDRISEVLESVFGLSQYQQQKFWDEERYSVWAKRSQVVYSIKDLRDALAATLVPDTN